MYTSCPMMSVSDRCLNLSARSSLITGIVLKVENRIDRDSALIAVTLAGSTSYARTSGPARAHSAPTITMFRPRFAVKAVRRSFSLRRSCRWISEAPIPRSDRKPAMPTRNDTIA
jgi:hypothetical protein